MCAVSAPHLIYHLLLSIISGALAALSRCFPPLRPGMAVAGSRPQLRAHLDALAADLADEWEPAALYAVLAEEASLAAAEALIKERICADPSGLGVGRSGRPTRAGRRLCELRVLQYDRAELPSGHTQIRAQVALRAVRATWTCLAEPLRAVLTICASHDAAGPPTRLLQMRATREAGGERGHCTWRPCVDMRARAV